MIGSPFAGDRMLFDAIIRARVSICASIDKRHVDGHLVTVEVSVERRTDERMQLNGLALNEHRLKCLDAQVCAVSAHGSA